MSIAHLRIRRRYLLAPIHLFCHPDTGRTVTVVGMVHHGRRDYYATVLEQVNRLRQAGAVVLCEGSGLSAALTDPPADLTDVQRQIVTAAGEIRDLHTRLSRHGQWVPQREMFGGIPQGWQRVDIGIVEQIRRQNGPELLAARQAEAARLQRILTSRIARMRYRVGMELGLRFSAAGYRYRRANDHLHMTGREDMVMAAVDSRADDVVLVWGVNHLPGFARRLAQRGFVHDDAPQWLTVARLQPMWLMLGKLAVAAMCAIPRLRPRRLQVAATGIAQTHRRRQPIGQAGDEPEA